MSTLAEEHLAWHNAHLGRGSTWAALGYSGDAGALAWHYTSLGWDVPAHLVPRERFAVELAGMRARAAARQAQRWRRYLRQAVSGFALGAAVGLLPLLWRTGINAVVMVANIASYAVLGEAVVPLAATLGFGLGQAVVAAGGAARDVAARQEASRLAGGERTAFGREIAAEVVLGAPVSQVKGSGPVGISNLFGYILGWENWKPIRDRLPWWLN